MPLDGAESGGGNHRIGGRPDDGDGGRHGAGGVGGGGSGGGRGCGEQGRWRFHTWSTWWRIYFNSRFVGRLSTILWLSGKVLGPL